MNILITGSSSYIGRNLIQKLEDQKIFLNTSVLIEIKN